VPPVTVSLARALDQSAAFAPSGSGTNELPNRTPAISRSKIAGRLRNHAAAWRDAGASAEVLRSSQKDIGFYLV